MFGISTNYDESTDKTTVIDVWEGSFMSDFVGDARIRNGARSATFRTYWGDSPVKVTLPDGVTFPRTEDNFADIDAAVSAAFSRHFDGERVADHA